jgi:prepilin-type N-terminal cleavage/methylation domain-containing protein
VNARLAPDEDGVTLIELLVAMSIIGVLTVAVTGALFVGIRTTRDTRTSLDQSNAEQIISTYVTKDVQGADAVRAGVTSACGGQPAALETTTRTDPLASSSDVVVAYRVTGTTLLRQVCGPTPSMTRIARDVTSFIASGSDPLSVSVTTTPSSTVGSYSWSLEVRRRQQ